MTTTEHLVALEEARSKATDGPWKKNGYKDEWYGECIEAPNGHGVCCCEEKSEDFIVLARNCPVNFRKLGEFIETMEYLSDSQTWTLEGLQMRIKDAIAALEEKP